MCSLLGSLHAQGSPNAVESQTLIHATSSWDGTPYRSYPRDKPQLTILKITIPPHTALEWHSHPVPSAGYILAGQLTVETKAGKSKVFHAGDAIAESVNVVHRGISGNEPTVLIVFYAGTPSLPLARPVGRAPNGVTSAR
jgi:quercetin dioxygenase-like cupin family protein